MGLTYRDIGVSIIRKNKLIKRTRDVHFLFSFGRNFHAYEWFVLRLLGIETLKFLSSNSMGSYVGKWWKF